MSIKVAEVKTHEGLTLPTNLIVFVNYEPEEPEPEKFEHCSKKFGVVIGMNTVNKKQRKSGHIFCWLNPLEVERID